MLGVGCWVFAVWYWVFGNGVGVDCWVLVA